jgi:hypothetical protein
MDDNERNRLVRALTESRRVRTPKGCGEIVARIAPTDTTAYVLPDGGGRVQQWPLVELEPIAVARELERMEKDND